jgi:hypothetical protein
MRAVPLGSVLPKEQHALSANAGKLPFVQLGFSLEQLTEKSS